jgi:hypothetical protein
MIFLEASIGILPVSLARSLKSSPPSGIPCIPKLLVILQSSVGGRIEMEKKCRWAG